MRFSSASHRAYSDTFDLVESYYQPPTGPGDIDPTLQPRGSFAIGYGQGGGNPCQYRLDGQDVEVGFLKLFITTHPINLQNVPQPSPFNPQARKAIRPPIPVEPEWTTETVVFIQRQNVR